MAAFLIPAVASSVVGWCVCDCVAGAAKKKSKKKQKEDRYCKPASEMATDLPRSCANSLVLRAWPRCRRLTTKIEMPLIVTNYCYFVASCSSV